jgi:hypothetical protein
LGKKWPNAQINARRLPPPNRAYPASLAAHGPPWFPPPCKLQSNAATASTRTASCHYRPLRLHAWHWAWPWLRAHERPARVPRLSPARATPATPQQLYSHAAMVQTPEEEEGPVCKGSPFLIFRSYFLKIIGETLFFCYFQLFLVT